MQSIYIDLIQLKLKLKMNGSSVLANGREALAQRKGSNTNYDQLSLTLAAFPSNFPLFLCNYSTN